MKLSDKLIELRKEQGWSQEDFAEKLDVSRQAISRWENGVALPDAQNILKISKLFNVTADYLLNDDHEGELPPPTLEAELPVPAPTAPQKKRLWGYVIPAICLVALLVVVIVTVIHNRKEPLHVHPIWNIVREHEIAPTCTALGSYDEVIYCTECGEELSRTTRTVEKLAHTLSSAVTENRVEPTCTAVGSYDEVVYCTACDGEITRTPHTVAMLEHTPDDSVRENTVTPSCTKPGSYDQVVYCIACDGEMTRTTHTVAPVFHALMGSVVENEVAATCTVVGSYDEAVYCMDCNEEVLRTHRTTEKLAHEFQDRKCIACGEDQPTESLIYMSNGDGTCFVDGRDCLEEHVVIPAYSPAGDKVVHIKSYAFRGKSMIKSVKIPETVTLIGDSAFEDCTNLESINLPSGLTMISSATFKGCHSLKSITIPSKVRYIGMEAFEECWACKELVIPASVSKIGKNAFRDIANGDGVITFEVYAAWALYDDQGACVKVLYFQTGVATPYLYLAYLHCDRVWERV